MRTAIYAGSFDPVTLGHAWVIEQGVKLFDTLYIGIGINPSKKYMFTLQERLEMLNSFVDANGWAPDVHLLTFEKEFLVDVAKRIGAQYVLRGIRNAEDFNFEMGVKLVNEKIAPEIETVFLAPPRNLSEVSSSTVKGLVGCDGWENIAKHYVPQNVLNKLKQIST